MLFKLCTRNLHHKRNSNDIHNVLAKYPHFQSLLESFFLGELLIRHFDIAHFVLYTSLFYKTRVSKI